MRIGLWTKSKTNQTMSLYVLVSLNYNPVVIKFTAQDRIAFLKTCLNPKPIIVTKEKRKV